MLPYFCLAITEMHLEVSKELNNNYFLEVGHWLGSEQWSDRSKRKKYLGSKAEVGQVFSVKSRE